jgi:hypothetical protein
MSPDDSIKISQYDGFSNNYRSWLRSSQELFASAEILRREREKEESVLSGSSGITPVEFLTVWSELMLLAFGIECLLKSYWVSNGNKLAEKGNYKHTKKGEKPHDLVDLSKTVGISIDKTEENTLKTLSVISRGVGRYPACKSYLGDDFGIGWSFVDDNVLQQLIIRIKKEISAKQGSVQLA